MKTYLMSRFRGNSYWATCVVSAVAIQLLACSFAATAEPGEERFAAMVNRARPGTTIVLPAGDYGEVALIRRDFSPAVTIDGHAAHFSKITIRDSSGITIAGGTIVGTGGRSSGISILRAHNISIRSMKITAAHQGIVIDRSDNVTITGNQLVELISDGIDIALSHHIRIEKNTCRAFNPTPAVYDQVGKLVRDGDHPDCIQAWSRPPYPPTSDLTILDNEMTGQMQGVFLGNHVRNGIDDGGFDRVVIRNNRVTAGLPNAIYANGVRVGEITGNIIDTLPGAVLRGQASRPVRAHLYTEGSGVRVCGNRVADFPHQSGTHHC